ncbi:hypothetical protein BUE80_DR004676 [Diplocarpon rosae]|nr:hypothetical protein BUE80_DR004676 [Diplocarpon rosae]
MSCFPNSRKPSLYKFPRNVSSIMKRHPHDLRALPFEASYPLHAILIGRANLPPRLLASGVSHNVRVMVGHVSHDSRLFTPLCLSKTKKNMERRYVPAFPLRTILFLYKRRLRRTCAGLRSPPFEMVHN